jgi:hypothetical protein
MWRSNSGDRDYDASNSIREQARYGSSGGGDAVQRSNTGQCPKRSRPHSGILVGAQKFSFHAAAGALLVLPHMQLILNTGGSPTHRVLAESTCANRNYSSPVSLPHSCAPELYLQSDRHAFAGYHGWRQLWLLAGKGIAGRCVVSKLETPSQSSFGTGAGNLHQHD